MEPPKPFHFITKTADRKSPNPDAWALQLPHEKDPPYPVNLLFDDQIDGVLARRMIRLVNADGKAINGQVKATANVWQFFPNQPWESGSYQIIIDPSLEDLAGNRPGRLFNSKEKKGGEKEWIISFNL